MKRQGRRDTKPELALRRALHARGLRFRVDRRPIPGMRTRADVVFGPAKVAVFVNGCFWHLCPEHRTSPANNRAWWAEKLASNEARDRRVDTDLRSRGWIALRVWEHECTERAAQRIEQHVRARRSVLTL